MIKKILLAIVVLMFIIAFSYISSHYLSNQRTAKILSTVQSNVMETKVPTTIERIEGVDATGSADEDMYLNIDFHKVAQEYPDVKAWLRYIPCDIDYPVVQTEDNETYLSVGLDKNYSVNGWIFFDCRNEIDETGDIKVNSNTIIYGHNMKNGTMFGNLSDIVDKQYLADEKNSYIYLNSLTRRYLYKIFAVYKADLTVDFDFLQVSFHGAEKRNYISTARESTKQQGVTVPFVNVQETDTLLTLITCTDKEDERLVVNAVLVSDAVMKTGTENDH